jgi:hypothetical protein
VPHARNQGDATGRDRPGQLFVVVGPQVFDAAAAAAYDEHVAFTPVAGGAHSLRDPRARAFALDRCRINDHRKARRAAPQRRQHVAQGRRLRRGHDAQHARKARQRALPRGVEQAFALELRLELLEGFVQRAQACASHHFDVQLEFAARFVKARARAHFHLHAVGRLPAEQHRFLAEHHTVDLRGLVLQSEVAVAGVVALEIGDFSAHPRERQMPLHDLPGEPVQLGDGEHARRRCDAGEFEHGADCSRGKIRDDSMVQRST